MRITEISPFIRYASVHNQSVPRFPSITYDCRLQYILDGMGTYTINGKTYRLAPDMLILYQPGTEYAFTPEPIYHCIALDFDFMQNFSHIRHPQYPLPVEDFDKAQMHPRISFSDYGLFDTPLVLEHAFPLRQMLTELVEEFRSGKLFFHEKSGAMLKNILLEIVRFSQSDRKKSDICDTVLSYIDAHTAEDLSNERLGEMMRLDPCYLNRLIKNYTGHSLHRNVIRHRIQTATKFLLNTNLPLEEIAHRTGFCDAAHFSACFKKQTGSSPSRYRKG